MPRQILRCSTLALALWSACAAAQQSPQPDQAQDAADLDRIVVTAAGRPQALSEAPASISVIEREEIASRPFRTVEDALRRVEGVAVTGESPQATDVTVRGLPGEYTLIMVDGVRQSTRETMNRGTSGVQAALVPPLDAIERIEVVRGSMSALYGSDAMGGVVNIITRRNPERWTGSVTLAGTVHEDGDYGDGSNLSAWLGGPLAGGLSLQVYGNQAQRDEDAIHFDNYTSGTPEIEDESIGARLNLAIGDYQDLSLAASHHRLEYIQTEGLSVPADYGSSRERFERDSLTLVHDASWGAFDSRLSVQHEVGEDAFWLAGEQDPAVPRVRNTVYDAMFTVPGQRQTWTFGGQYIDTRLDRIGNQDNVNGYPNTAEITRGTWALFAQDEITFGDSFKLTLGGRYDDADDFGSHFTPRVYANYQLAPGWTLRGGISEGFKAPKLRQSSPAYCMITGGGTLLRGPLCGNPELEPETSTTSELGVRFGNAATDFGATVFHTRFEDKVASYATEEDDPLNPGWVIYVYDNIDEVTLQGVELTFGHAFTPAWRLDANYTYTDSERSGGGEPAFDGSSLDGYPLDMTPEHVANAELTWQASEQLSLSLAGQYEGEQYWAGFRNGALNVRTREGATTFDVGANWRATDHLTLRASVLNVTDEIVPVDTRGRYEGLDGNWMIDEGRRLWMSVNLSF